jgi:hypothetical protein
MSNIDAKTIALRYRKDPMGFHNNQAGPNNSYAYDDYPRWRANLSAVADPFCTLSAECGRSV